MKSYLCLLFVIFSISLADNARTQERIEIGVSAPLTGESAVFGDDIRDVLTFAREHFKDENISLNIQDDQCSGKTGASVAQYFMQRKVRAVLGYACVESIMPAIPILKNAKIPVISVLASGPEITGADKGVFNLYPSDDLGISVLLQRLNELGVHDILVLTALSAFPIGITNSFKKQTKGRSDLKTTFIEYPAMTSDFLSILTREGKKNSFQAILINYSSVSEFIAFMRQRTQLKHSGLIFTSYLNGFDSIKAEKALDLVNGVEFYDTAPIEKILGKNDRQIFDQYLHQKGHLKSSDGYFPFIFNGYVVLREALRQDADLAKALLATNITTGIGEPFHFDRAGNIQGGIPFVMKKVVGEKLLTFPF